jgi:hypothetical protein
LGIFNAISLYFLAECRQNQVRTATQEAKAEVWDLYCDRMDSMKMMMMAAKKNLNFPQMIFVQHHCMPKGL